MLNRDSVMSHSSTFETLQSNHGPSRRTRPPDLDLIAAEENRVPLRPEKASRRESRLGLRNIFSRSKTSRDMLPPISPIDIPKSMSSRTSVTDMNNWPYSQSAGASDHTPTTPRSPRILSTMFENAPSGPPPIRVMGPAKPARGPLATWHPPPLFKAFPQAIKHMTLPAASLPTEVILRMHERRANATGETPIEQPEQQPQGEKLKSKKKHRQNMSSSSMPKFEWTNKIYVLATSGYLLQYAADGPFDRLPEKVLHLGKNSAAFASDVIPGRHWVVQVSSVMESDGTATPDSRSLFSRMTFRVAERRQASNFLMVFETAEDMEGWIAALRREIEILGGKKTLNETGSPKAEDEVSQLREQPSQRTLVVRDPERFSRILPQNFGWHDATDNEGSVATITDPDTVVDQSLDDISTTNSFVSHDGRQLDNLRDSANRLSFISSGQRTIVTSAGSSSPETSPTVDTFPTHFDEKPHQEALSQLEARPRPNAAAILDRRQSMQVMAPFVDLRGGPVNLRPQSTYRPGPAPEPILTPPPRVPVTPNFSVPKSSSRRFSYMRSQEPGMSTQPMIRECESLPRLTGRKAPPTTLAVARPLSMVADQPSPMDTVDARPATRHGEETYPQRTSEDHTGPLFHIPNPYDLPSRRSSQIAPDEPHVEVNRPISSRRLSNMRPWRKPDHQPLTGRNFTAPMGPAPMQRARSRPSLPGVEEQPRCRSSLDLHSNTRGETSSVRTRSRKRASMHSMHSEQSSRYSMSTDLPIPFAPESLPEPPPPPTAPLPPIPTSTSNPHLRADSIEKALLAGRRSMPQLNEGPPPAPPPTCALPPIPQQPPGMF